MKKTDLAYMAGFFDGEGTITLARRTRGGNQFRAQISLVNTNEWIVPYLKIKRPQAELAISFLKRHNRVGERRTPESILLDEADKILMLRHNKRGNQIESIA